MLMALIMVSAFSKALPTHLPQKRKHDVKAETRALNPTPPPVPTDGQMTETYANGQPRIVREFKDGALVSEVAFTEAGALQTKKIYEKGRVVSDSTFYANGSLQKSIRRSNAKDGVEVKIQTFFENGQPAVSGSALSDTFSDEGRAEGPYTSWSDRGVLKETGTYHRGQKSGVWKLNLERVLRTEVYEDGHLVRRLDQDPKTKAIVADDRFDQNGTILFAAPATPKAAPGGASGPGAASTPAP